MEVKYLESHEWARMENDKVVIGISEYAQKQLSDIVYVELPVLGSTVVKGKYIATIESIKSASDVYAPLSGKITKINDQLLLKPELINQSPMQKGWIYEMEMTEMSEWALLLTTESYFAKIK